MTETVNLRSGRGWAYLGVGLGGLVSIAANVAHSFIPPAGAPAGWTPQPGAVAGAVVWPVFLFIAVEILARIPWPTGRIWQFLRWAGLAPVAWVAALVSYRHLSGLLASYGEEDLVVWLGPLAVDGLMVMATGALLATSPQRKSETVTEPIPVSVPVEPVRPIAVPRTAPTAIPQPTPTLEPPSSEPTTIRASSPVDRAPAAEPTSIPTPAAMARRITPARPTSTPTASAAGPRPDPAAARRPRPSNPAPPSRPLAPSSTDFPVSASDAAQRLQPVAPELLARAAQAARQYRTDHGTPITAGQLAVRLKVTSDQAAQALAVIDLDPNSHSTSVTTANGRRPKGSR